MRAIRVLGNNVYVGGSFGNVGGIARQRLAAVTKGTGAVVPGWNASASGVVFTIAGTSTLYIGGDFSTVDGSAAGTPGGGQRRHGIARSRGRPRPTIRCDRSS